MSVNLDLKFNNKSEKIKTTLKIAEINDNVIIGDEILLNSSNLKQN